MADNQQPQTLEPPLEGLKAPTNEAPKTQE